MYYAICMASDSKSEAGREHDETHSPAVPVLDLAGEPEQFLKSSVGLLALPARLGVAWSVPAERSPWKR